MQNNEMQPNQQRALELAWKGNTINDIARELGVHRTTVWRWTQDPEFVTLLNQLRSETRTSIAMELEQASVESVSCLRDLIACPDTADGHRIRAAVSILDRAGFSPTAVNQAPIAIVPPIEELVDPFTEEGMAAIVQELVELPLGFLEAMWQQIRTAKEPNHERTTGQIPHEFSGGTMSTNQQTQSSTVGE
jgi:AcrR family transcriptional regulator